ncbi:MAG TPA: DUF11 domain-containing protein, partial [Mycobacterium sp.]|nr:DUF11 domain-containing protein [Mycobacterium sp.]
MGFTNGTIEVSTDGGASFTALAGESRPENFVTGLSVDPSDPDAITATFSYNDTRYRPGFPHVEQYAWSGSPGSGTWTTITGSGLPAAVSHVVYDNGALVAGTDAGVYATGAAAGSATVWTALGSGLPNVQVQDLYVDPSNSNLYVVTHGRGAWVLPTPTCTAPPTVTSNPSDQTVTAPNQAQFTAAATNPSGCTTLTVQWQVSVNGGAFTNDTTDSGNQTNTLTISPTSTSMSGNQYRAVYNNETSFTMTTAATLTVNPPPADLSITNIGSPDPVISGQKLTYTVTATNTGGQAAHGVIVTDSLPTTGKFVSMSATPATTTCRRSASKPPSTHDGTVTCNVGDLGAGNSATITIVITPTKPGTITAAAKVTASNVSPSDTDDSATVTTTVKGT